MTRYAVLDATGIDEAAHHTRALWGGGRDAPAHRARIEEQIARSGGRMRYVGLVGDDGVVCSLKHYTIALDTPDGRVEAVGIGAVFTPEARRGAGLATALIEAVLEEARGARAALLYSDIAPSFYERLGFTALSSVTWSCPVEALPAEGAPPRARLADPAALCAFRDRSYAGAWLRVHRDAESWRYGAWRNHAGPAERLGAASRPEGYVLARRGGGDVWWIDDAAGDRDALWATFRAQAEAQGCETVAGWLRADLAGGPFVAQARRRCIPMVAPLAGDWPLDRWRSHFASVDHF